MAEKADQSCLMRSGLPLTHGLKEEDCGAHRDVQAVQTAKHGNADMGRCSPPPDIRKAGGFRTHDKCRSAAHVHVIVKGRVLKLGRKYLNSTGLKEGYGVF